MFGFFVAITVGSSSHGVLSAVGKVGFLGLIALPISIGIGILRYRLYEIDRLISRTLSYALLTGLLVGVFVGLVLLTTRVLPFSSPVGVAASTLARRGPLLAVAHPPAAARRPPLQPRPLRRRGDRRGVRRQPPRRGRRRDRPRRARHGGERVARAGARHGLDPVVRVPRISPVTLGIVGLLAALVAAISRRPQQIPSAHGAEGCRDHHAPLRRRRPRSWPAAGRGTRSAGSCSRSRSPCS